jgi:hypothetical protein
MRRISKQIVALSLAASLVALGSALVSSAARVDSASGQVTGRGVCPSASGREVVLTAPLPRNIRINSMIVANKTIWIASGTRAIGGPGKLFRVDASSGRVQRIFRLAGNPWSIAYGFGSL